MEASLGMARVEHLPWFGTKNGRGLVSQRGWVAEVVTGRNRKGIWGKWSRVQGGAQKEWIRSEVGVLWKLGEAWAEGAIALGHDGS